MKKLLIVFALLLGFIGTANAGGYGGIGGAASSTTITGPWTFTSSVTINNVVDTSSAVVRDRFLIGNGATISTMTATVFEQPEGSTATLNGYANIGSTLIDDIQIKGLMALPSNAAPRTNVTPLRAYELIINSGATPDEVCISTGVLKSEWALLSNFATACSN